MTWLDFRPPHERGKPRVHDLRRTGWGHSWTLDRVDGGWNADRAHLTVWLTPPARPGDVLLVDAVSGERHLVVVEVRQCRDPHDMAFLTVREQFDPPVRWWHRTWWLLTRQRRPA